VGAIIDRYLPDYQLVERHQRLVKAEPAVVLGAAKSVRGKEARLIGPLFFIRGLPARIVGRQTRSQGRADRPLLDFFIPLEGDAGEVVAGIVGRF